MSPIDQTLPFGLSGEGVLILLSASAAFLMVVAVWYGLLERHPGLQRVVVRAFDIRD